MNQRTPPPTPTPAPGSPAPTPPQVHITSPGPDPQTVARTTAIDVVAELAKEYTNKILTYFIVAALAATAAVVWDLNGQIYKVVGSSETAEKIQEYEVEQLKAQIADMQSQINLQKCVDDKRVANKAGCYHGN